MISLQSILEKYVGTWVEEYAPELSGGSWVTLCGDEKHGHFQSNVAMVAVKVLKRNPREIAGEVKVYLEGQAEVECVEVAGPGFVNIRVKGDAVKIGLEAVVGDGEGKRFLLDEKDRCRVVVDFSGPNVAKEMHVGHIRSTILGDTLARVARVQGHEVTTDNHIGDWGTQFGKLLVGYGERGEPELTLENALEVLEGIYKDVNERCKVDEALLTEARSALKKLQDGDERSLELWKRFIDFSRQAFDMVYGRVGVKFDHTLGESFYNDKLKEVVDELVKLGVARESKGAQVVFFEENEKLKNHPFLIQKSDGAALYATTDLATLEFRLKEWNADRIIYVTDGRQQMHFQQLFETARLWGKNVELEHVWFGAILGEDRKPLKTRDGNPIKLRFLLDEAEKRAEAIIREKNPDMSPEESGRRAGVIGIGALKYADQAQNRNLDYVFDWDKLLAFDGNTAPYVLNAYVRTRSILRKAGMSEKEVQGGEFSLGHEMEERLGRKILECGDVVAMVGREGRPHFLCQYLFELAGMFHRFYENCPVLKAEREELKRSRLKLCLVTGETLRTGLNLLGIETLEEM